MPRPTLKSSQASATRFMSRCANHLAGLGDVVVALERQKDYPTVERLAIAPYGAGRTRTFDRRIMSRAGSRP